MKQDVLQTNDLLLTEDFNQENETRKYTSYLTVKGSSLNEKSSSTENSTLLLFLGHLFCCR